MKVGQLYKWEKDDRFLVIELVARDGDNFRGTIKNCNQKSAIGNTYTFGKEELRSYERYNKFQQKLEKKFHV